MPKKTCTKDEGDASAAGLKARILAALLENHICETPEVAIKDLANACGYGSEKTKAFAEELVCCKKGGFVESGKGGHVRITKNGIKEAGGDVAAVAAPQTNQEKQDRFKAFLKKPDSDKVFATLCDGQPRTAYDLAYLCGHSHPNVHRFFYAFQELKKRGLVEASGSRDRRQLWRLVDRFFPEGRPSEVAAASPPAPPPRKKARTKRSLKKETMSTTTTKAVKEKAQDKISEETKNEDTNVQDGAVSGGENNEERDPTEHRTAAENGPTGVIVSPDKV